MRRLLTALTCTVLVLAGCGDDDEGAAATTTTENADETATTNVAEQTTTTEVGTEIEGGVGDFEPGDVSFRLVHVAPDAGPIDVYAFTSQGLVEEYLLERDVPYGTVLDDLRPPTDGKLVLFPAGTTDLSIFSNDDLIADLSTAFPEDEGPERTVVLAPEDDGGVDVVEYWETPAPSEVGRFANALPPAVEGRGMLVMVHDAGELTPVIPALSGAGACLEPQDPGQANIAVGGTAVLAYEVDPGANDLTFHSFDDQDFDCIDAPVLTATVEVAAGDRLLVLLYEGDDGNLAVMTLPLA